MLQILPGPIYVTECVWDEVAFSPDKPGVSALIAARDEGLLAVVLEGEPDAIPYLDAGESTVLTAAAVVRGAVIIDERKARQAIAKEPELRDAIQGSIGSVGLILLAKQRGNVTKVRPLLDDLIRQGFRIGPGLYAGAVEQAGELRD